MNEDNDFGHFSLHPVIKLTLSNHFLHVVGLDRTYKTSNHDRFLYQIIILDFNFMITPICFNYIKQEASELITEFRQFFNQYFLVNKPLKYKHIFSEIFPNLVDENSSSTILYRMILICP